MNRSPTQRLKNQRNCPGLHFQPVACPPEMGEGAVSSNPVIPTLLDREPFSENVEEGFW
jgi:hypothetical protein